MRARVSQPRNPVDDVDRKIEPVDLISNRQLQWRIDVSFLFVAAHVNVDVICAAVGELMDEPRVAVEIEDHWLIRGEQ